MARKRDQDNPAGKSVTVRRKTSKVTARPELKRELAKEIEIGRRFMKEYREVFEKLAKT